LSSISSSTSHRHSYRARRSLHFAVVALAVACCALSAFGVDPNRMVSQYIHDSWGTDRGFPGGSISSIAQTPDGYLWIGTDRGLIRFDGINFRKFEQTSPASFPVGPVRKLLADTQGDLWILLQDTKLWRYHDGTFSLMQGEAENGITAITQAAGSEVLLSSLAMGVLVYKDGNFANASESLASGQQRSEIPPDFSWSTGLALHRLIEPTTAVISLAATSDGKIWLGTQDRGLAYLYEGNVHLALPVTRGLRINCLLPIENQELWVGTNKGVLLWNGAQLTRDGVPSALSNVEVLSLARDRDLNIWVGTTGNLFRINTTGVSSLVEKGPSTGTGIAALLEDREGNLWIGGAQHLDCLRDSTFVSYTLPRTQSGGALYVDPSDDAWIAPSEGGLWLLKGGRYSSITAAGLARDVVYSIASTRPDTVWLGRQQGGLTHLQSIHGVLTARTYTRADGLAQNSVYAVVEGRDGTIWSGTLTGGASELKNGHFTNYTTANGLASNTVSSIVEGTDGTLWFGTPNGLSKMSANGWRTYQVADGLPSADINCLFEDTAGVLWIGTEQGLAFFKAGLLNKLAAEPDSLHEPIFGIAEDKSGRLWLSTANHVLQIQSSTPTDKVLTKTDVHEYGLPDGLNGTEGVKRDKSVVVDSHGRIWFSTNHGVSAVNPARASMYSTPSVVQIEAVLADGNPFELKNEPLEVPAGREKLTFRFASLSLADAQHARYRYRLDGVDKNWSDPQSTREASYNNLSAGLYRFRVVASNNVGQWNGPEAAVDFMVEPQLWQTWWFRLAVVLCAGLAALALYRIRMQRLTRLLSVRFEERLAERTRVAQDLHDTLLQGIYSASIHFDVANNRLQQDSPAKPAVERGLGLLRQVSQEGRNALRSLRTNQPATDGLEHALSLLQKEFALPESVDFEVATEGESRVLRPLVRDEAYLIAREAVINAFRHAHATRINIDVHYSSRYLRIFVRDNGCGIDADLLRTGREGHWGLAGMRERADKVGAKLEVLSAANAGTEIQLSVPGAVAFQQNSASQSRNWLSWLYPEGKAKDPKKSGEEQRK